MSSSADASASLAPDRLPPSRLRGAAEVVLLAIVAFAPWPFASVEPIWEAVLTAGVAGLMMLWAVDSAWSGRWAVRFDAVAGCLAGLILLAVLQLVPLPVGLVGVLSPTAREWHQALLPEQAEVLPGEPAPGKPRPTWLPLSVDPYSTQVFVARLLAVFSLYMLVRNWLASRDSFRRLAWVVAANGAALATVGLLQFFTSSPQVVFWSVETDGQVFGPFVCRNHFPDYVNICLGLGLGLLLRPTRQTDDVNPNITIKDRLFDLLARTFRSPTLFVLAIALVVMAISIPFSLSRGGLLGTIGAAAATAVVAARITGRLTTGGGALAGVGALAIALVAWIGWGPVEERFRTVWQGQAVDTRLPLWSDALSLCPKFLVTGTGSGSFGRVEPLARTEESSTVVYDNAHNEYLEALLEGGIIRLALTLALVIVVLTKAASAYARLQDRATGPLALGAFFGLAALTLHSFTDFGIHIPAVAALATVVAAHIVAAADDPGYAPIKVRRRKSDGKRSSSQPSESANNASVEERLVLRGSIVYAITAGVVLLAGVMAWGAYLRGRADELGRAAETLALSSEPAACDARISIAAARVTATPGDPTALHDLGLAHFAAARLAATTTSAAVAGVPAAYVGLPDVLPRGVANRHVVAGLAACRAARSAGMLYSPPHVRLGQYASFFAVSEPPIVHFERAKRLRSADAAVWYAVGSEAFWQQDYSAALTSWRRAMQLSPAMISLILWEASAAPEAMPLTELIPPDPATALAAANMLYPDRFAQQEMRRPILAKASTSDTQRLRLPDLYALAAIFDELGQPERAAATWEWAINRFPNDPGPRDRYARWLMADERYDEALLHLEWLRERQPDDTVLQDRLDTARHALRLKRIIEGQ